MPKPSPRPLYHPKYWLTWLSMSIVQLIVLLPSPILIKLGRLLGRVLLRTAKRRRHICETNLGLCFPKLKQHQKKQLLVDTFEANGIGIIEAAMSWLKPGKRFLNVKINNLALIDRLKREGKGILMVSAHYTCLDIAGKCLATQLQYNVIYRRQNNPVINYLMERGRNVYLESPPIDQHDIRGMLKCLKKGGVLWYPADQDHGRKSSVFAPFYGVQAATLDMPTRLVKISGAAIVHCSYFREKDNSYSLILKELKDFTGTDAIADASLLNKTLEESLQRFPEQYMWVHRRFKTRPEGEPGVY